MVGNPNHGQLYYRCRASRDCVRQHDIAHPPVLYLREHAITGPVDRFLCEALSGDALAGNLRRLAEAHHRAALTAHQANDETARLRKVIEDRDAKIGRHRAALHAGSDRC
jgi:site-specific DNA recombinase